jgi:hypothetical protein
LNTSLSSRRVKQFIDAVLMVVGREESHVVDPMISDEFQQLITLCAITAHPRLANGGNAVVHIRIMVKESVAIAKNVPNAN